MRKNFGVKCVNWSPFCILDEYPQAGVDATIIWNPFFSQTNTAKLLAGTIIELLKPIWSTIAFYPSKYNFNSIIKRLHQGYNPWLMPTNYQQENSAILDTLLASFACLAFILASTFELTFLEVLCFRVQHKEISLSKDT